MSTVLRPPSLRSARRAIGERSHRRAMRPSDRRFVAHTSVSGLENLEIPSVERFRNMLVELRALQPDHPLFYTIDHEHPARWVPVPDAETVRYCDDMVVADSDLGMELVEEVEA